MSAVFIFIATSLIAAQKEEDHSILPLWSVLQLLTVYGYMHLTPSRLTKMLTFLAILVHLGVFIFMGFHHCRASFSVFETLRNELAVVN